MSNIIKIKSIRISRLNNAEYTQFLSNVETLVSIATLDKLKLKKDLFLAFQESIKKLTDISRQSKISPETEELRKLDKQRDDLVSYLLSVFRTESKTPVETKKIAATELYKITKPYRGTSALPNRQKTQTIEALVLDLSKPNAIGHIGTLVLQDIVVQLNTLNKNYQKLTAERADRQITNTLESSKKVRKLADSQYDEISTLAFVASIAYPTPETANFISSLNKLIDDTLFAYKQRTGRIKKNK